MIRKEQYCNSPKIVLIVLVFCFDLRLISMASLDNHNIWNTSENVEGSQNLVENLLKLNAAKSSTIYQDKTIKFTTVQNTDSLEDNVGSSQLLLQNIFEQVFESNQNVQIPSTIAFHNAETIAILERNIAGNIVTKCNLVEIVNLEDSNRIISGISNETNFLVQEIEFRDMLSVVTACQTIDTVVSNETSNTDNTFETIDTLSDLSIATMLSGIVPGTKWCGMGDIATNYDDLGQERETDKCCRAHDRCPNKIYSLSYRYGLVNWSLYTKSHCDCDLLLYNCLKKTGSKLADLLGTIFFDYLQFQCIEEGSTEARQMFISETKLPYFEK